MTMRTALIPSDVMTYHETCICNSYLDVSSKYREEITVLAEGFRMAHACCREESAQPIQFIENITDAEEA